METLLNKLEIDSETELETELGILLEAELETKFNKLSFVLLFVLTLKSCFILHFNNRIFFY